MRKIYVILICIIILVFTIIVHYYIIGKNNENDVELLVNSLPSATFTLAPSFQHAQTTAPKVTASYSPENELYSKLLSPANEIIASDIASGFPGAVLLISIDGETIFYKSYGYLKTYDGYDVLTSPIVMQKDTVFDLASLTKTYATTLSIMKLVDSDLLSIDDYVHQYLPDFNKEDYNKITIKQLLNHTSGFPSDIKFFRPDVEEGEAFYSTQREKTISLLSQVPLEGTPGESVQYSDIGYMVLGTIVEQISVISLDEFADRYIYSPLSISSNISYNPLDAGFDQDNIACTERIGNTRDNLTDFPNVRTYTLQGEVHDEKAYYSMDGVSGHAGLFADAKAINALNLMLLNGGVYENVPIFSSDVVSQFTSIESDMRYQLGFANAISFKTLAETVPEGTLCHSGWTGTFSLIDKKNGLSIVLLTNKRHTPITDGEFEGASYDTGKYYNLIKTIYESLGLS